MSSKCPKWKENKVESASTTKEMFKIEWKMLGMKYTNSIFADIHFIEYMGAFYTKVMATGLVTNGFCTVDSSEVLQNVQRIQEEDIEKSKRSLAADGLVSMHNSVAAKKREYKKSGPMRTTHQSLNLWSCCRMRKGGVVTKFLDPSLSQWICVAGSSNSQTFQPPTKKGKGVGKSSKKTVKKSGPNLTGVSAEMTSDADRDAILIESGMEPGASTSGAKIWKILQTKADDIGFWPCNFHLLLACRVKAASHVDWGTNRDIVVICGEIPTSVVSWKGQHDSSTNHRQDYRPPQWVTVIHLWTANNFLYVLIFALFFFL